ncbi:hypothetical protein H376_210 [Rickettsia prowazekii str. GvF12]|nr:hypothetical protein H376_210 [Rickettsia prowazekii str. GvF12]
MYLHIFFILNKIKNMSLLKLTDLSTILNNSAYLLKSLALLK